MGTFLCHLLLVNMCFLITCPTSLASIVSRGGGHSNNAGIKQRSSSRNNEAHHSAAVTLALPDIKMIKFDPDYDLHIRPNPQADGQPIDVYFSVNLRNVLQVNEIEQLIGVEMTIRMSWRDTRIKVVSDNNDTSALAKEVNEKGYVALNPLLARRIW